MTCRLTWVLTHVITHDKAYCEVWLCFQPLVIIFFFSGHRTYSYDSSESDGSESAGESDSEEDVSNQLSHVSKANTTLKVHTHGLIYNFKYYFIVNLQYRVTTHSSKSSTIIHFCLLINMVFLNLALSAAILVPHLYGKHLTCPCRCHPSLPHGSMWEIYRPITICNKRVNHEMKKRWQG